MYKSVLLGGGSQDPTSRLDLLHRHRLLPTKVVHLEVKTPTLGAQDGIMCRITYDFGSPWSYAYPNTTNQKRLLVYPLSTPVKVIDDQVWLFTPGLEFL